MIYNVQCDKRWAFDDMGLTTDHMKDYGCLVTAIANIFDITPKELNDYLRKNKGYQFFTGNYVKDMTESYIVWSVAEKHLGFNHIPVKDISDINGIYITSIKHRIYKGAHYCNFIGMKNNKFEIFDTDFGDKLLYNRQDILTITRIIKS
jgi:hypothetical protein